MKKLVLIMVSALVITVFVSFNYLLWAREAQIKEYQNKVTNMDEYATSLNKEIRMFRENSEATQSNVKQLEQRLKNSQDDNSKLEQQKQLLYNNIDLKNEIINQLKQQADLKPFEELIKKWVDNIDKGQYAEAYKLLVAGPVRQDGVSGLDEFTNMYKNSIKSMKLKSLKLETEEIPNDKVGDIIYKVGLEVKIIGSDSSKEFTDGVNERYFNITYDKEKKNWAILSISLSP